jgi:hypothetical protein
MWGETAEDMQVIWVKMESKYSCEEGWTGGKSVEFPAHEIGAIIRHLRPQRDVLEGKWHEHFGN